MIATLGVYASVRSHAFLQFDDAAYVTDNGMVRAGLTWGGLRWALTTPYAGNWHPLTWLSHMADVQLFGLDPGWHHLANLFLHVLTSLLLFRSWPSMPPEQPFARRLPIRSTSAPSWPRSRMPA